MIENGAMIAEKSMITTFLFDNNGVLTTSDEERTNRVVADFLEKSEAEIKKIILPFVVDLDKGIISQEEFYEQVIRTNNLSVSVEDFSRIHQGAYIAKSDMQAVVGKLKENFEVKMLTNFGDAFWQNFERWGLHNIFHRDDVFVSSDIGLAKPDIAIYKHVIKTLGVDPKCILFIDDKNENIIAAQKAGMHGYLFTGIDTLEKYIDSRILGL